MGSEEELTAHEHLLAVLDKASNGVSAEGVRWWGILCPTGLISFDLRMPTQRTQLLPGIAVPRTTTGRFQTRNHLAAPTDRDGLTAVLDLTNKVQALGFELRHRNIHAQMVDDQFRKGNPSSNVRWIEPSIQREVALTDRFILSCRRAGAKDDIPAQRQHDTWNGNERVSRNQLRAEFLLPVPRDGREQPM